MNAYELADELDDACIEFVGDVWVSTFRQSATMLRQQADRIILLEAYLKSEADRIAELERLVSDMRYEKSSGVYDHSHKELSDEEIISIRQITKPSSADNWADTLAFARAIEERHGIK